MCVRVCVSEYESGEAKMERYLIDKQLEQSGRGVRKEHTFILTITNHLLVVQEVVGRGRVEKDK